MSNYKKGCVMDENGSFVGVHPKDLTEQELNDLGHEKMPLIEVIRQKCLDCTSHQMKEIRNCAVVKCANWPYRMNYNPFHKKGFSEEQTEKRKNTLKEMQAKKRAAKVPSDGLVKSIQDIENDKNLTPCDTVEDLKQSLGL